MKVGVNWQRRMQMVAFMLIAVICFFMPIRTRPEWAGGQPEARLCSHNCQEILYLTDLYLQL